MQLPQQTAPPCEMSLSGPPLRVAILALGTRGDVQPYIALGTHLAEVGGHRVLIASSDDHRALVEESGGSLQFHSIGIPRVDQPAEWLQAHSVADMIQRSATQLTKDYSIGASPPPKDTPTSFFTIFFLPHLFV